MITFAGRRWRNVLLTVAAVAVLLAAHRLVFTTTLGRAAYATGWTLLVIMLVLAAYNLRKKLSVLPLLSSATWLQFHVYLGAFTIVPFVAHVGYAVPRGAFERLLALVYVVVAGSGVIGLFFTRLLPPRLNRRGENIVAERIPAARRRIRDRAEAIALGTVGAGSVTTIADLYRDRLHEFLSGPRHFWHHLVGSTRPRHALLAHMDALGRYLKPSDREGLRELAELVRLKDDLDYRWMGYSVLRWWLFVHLPLTYALLILAGVHVVLVQAFSGGAR